MKDIYKKVLNVVFYLCSILLGVALLAGYFHYGNIYLEIIPEQEKELGIFYFEYSGDFNLEIFAMAIGVTMGFIFSKITYKKLIKLAEQREIEIFWTKNKIITSVLFLVLFLGVWIGYILVTGGFGIVPTGYSGALDEFVLNKRLFAAAPSVAMSWTVGVFGVIFAWTIRRISLDHEEKIQPFHGDGVGGLKNLGNLTLWNTLNVSIQIVVHLINGIYLAILRETELHLFLYLLIIASFCFSLLVFYLPVKKIHDVIVKYKEDQLGRLSKLMMVLYEQIYDCQPEERMEKLEEFQNLEALKERINGMRDYPWDTNLFIKLGTTYLIPVIVMNIRQYIGM